MRPRRWTVAEGAGGFTLVELLICVAVVGLLVGIVLPALGGARQAGRNTGCLSQLRQLSLSTFSYAQDYRRVPVWPTLGAVPAVEVPRALWWCPADRVRPSVEGDSSYAYLGLLYMGDNPNIAAPQTLNPALALRRYEDNPYLPLYRDVELRHPHRNVAFWDGVVRRWED
jgi:prepilin-type N-terminal cleavage/methylation domain-containing protein